MWFCPLDGTLLQIQTPSSADESTSTTASAAACAIAAVATALPTTTGLNSARTCHDYEGNATRTGEPTNGKQSKLSTFPAEPIRKLKSPTNGQPEYARSPTTSTNASS